MDPSEKCDADATRAKRLSSLRTRAWANGLLHYAQVTSKSELAKVLQRAFPSPSRSTRPKDDEMYEEDRPRGLSDLYKYFSGQQEPTEGTPMKPGVLRRVDGLLPGSLDVFRNPIWMAAAPLSCNLKDVREVIRHSDLSVQNFYCGSDTGREDDSEAVYAHIIESFSEPIWIEIGEPATALDHLAVLVAICKTDWVRHTPLYAQVAQNICKTLGPVAMSPWFKELHADLFDMLEEEAWAFVRQRCNVLALSRGWRATKAHWLLEAT